MLYEGSLTFIEAGELLVVASGIYLPDQEQDLRLPHWGHGVLVPEPPGKVCCTSHPYYCLITGRL